MKILSEDKFAELLMEFSVAEASYSRLIEADTVALKTLVVRNARVLKEHNVSREQFLATYRWYNQHKQEFMEVYDLSLKKLEEKTEKVRSSKDTLLTTY